MLIRLFGTKKSKWDSKKGYFCLSLFNGQKIAVFCLRKMMNIKVAMRINLANAHLLDIWNRLFGEEK